MEFAEKAGLLCPETGAEAYRAIAISERGEPTWGTFPSTHRQQAAEKAGVLSSKIGAEAYKSIADDRGTPEWLCMNAAKEASKLFPETGAEALRVITRKPSKI